jgi:cytochrome c oxidase cbb3-type subunit I/II
MDDPRTMSPGSIMPQYPWLLEDDLDTASTPAKIRVMMSLGVPYPTAYDKIANIDLVRQEIKITKNLKESGIETPPNKEIIAIIAYLQRLGTDIKGENKIIFGQIAIEKPLTNK